MTPYGPHMIPLANLERTQRQVGALTRMTLEEGSILTQFQAFLGEGKLRDGSHATEEATAILVRQMEKNTASISECLG